MAFPFAENCELPHQQIFPEKAIRVTFCHHAFNSSIRGVSAGTGDDYSNFPDADISELLDMLRRVPEFRAERGREYDLSFILAVCVVATLAGAKNSREITTVASGICQCQLMMMGARWDYFRNCYRCPRRTVIWNVLGKIDAGELDRITGKWLLAQARKTKGEDGRIEWVIAIDGKVLRGSWTDENDQVTLFSAMLQDKGITVAQVRVPDGTNEITQVKALARQADIREGESVLVTLDAAHCNKDTAEFIGGKPGWDYLITVKTDKPALYGKVKEILAPLLGSDPDNVMTERGRGVSKTWSCWTADAKDVDFPRISQVACICREICSVTGEKLTKDVAVVVTSRNAERMTSADLNKHVREHWGIENKKHYIRDTVYREDGNQSWKGSGPQALASFRNFSTSLFAMKEVKNIKEATEIIHMDRHFAFHYMTT
jgi:predicted transposase YbfD/YdcC